ncbi:hypothetical protein [Niabella ginsengisoli]|uniref:S9 family peptidase n=1 Tax=Niabella ginsengisoli TaxID=522298 RepID=A0ABS9SGR3_9BACT|nr:hypothetical protein [Niabella ginsengisoli]MCH5597568.1 hypothetical protein [Niabella ginsengisoli]
MKRYSAIITFLLLANLLGAQTPQLTADDYKRAEQFLSYNTAKYVDWTNPYPQWLDGDKFWYKSEKDVFFVDPVKKVKRELIFTATKKVVMKRGAEGKIQMK